ncbi:MAG: hypothetical protein K2X93_09060 [Candidatus Obscuribacterales bacterium]|nr:hypothetical protein [Candidatus Obscuribacterales bacterium]
MVSSKRLLSGQRVQMNEVKDLVFHGAVSAAALLFDYDLTGLEEARRRVLSVWYPGVRVHAVQRALVVIFPQPIEVYTERCIGMPLVPARTGYGAPLIAMLLSDKLLDRIKAPPRSVVRLKQGLLTVEPLGAEEDPATWLIVGNFREVALISPIVPISELEPILKQEKFDVREKLASGSPKAEGMDEFIESFNKEAKNAKEKSSSNNSTAPDEGFVDDPTRDTTTESWLEAVLSKLFNPNESNIKKTSPGQKASAPSWLDNVLGSLFRDESQSTDNQDSATSQPPSNWADHMKMDFFKMLKNTGLLDFILQRQQDYVDKMIDLFEEGNWSEALRYGVPLGSQADGDPSEPFLDIPAPRSNLQINPKADSASSSFLYSQPDLYEKMKKLYRDSVGQLTNEGRYDEAAFVLAELLGEIEGAVSYLERHGRLVLAAELAEARKLPPGLIVRQWFLAGDIDRAVNIARLNGCFQEAVRLLEKDHKDQADELRKTWAIHLAEIGNYSAAAMIAIDVPELHEQALEWTRVSLQLRDKTSGHLLACWLTFFKAKDEWPLIKDRVVTLLDNESRELAPARYSFINSLYHPYTNEIKVLARKAGRAVLRDHGRQYISLSRESILRFLEDRSLWADASRCNMTVEARSLADAKIPIELYVSPDDIGTDTIYDAILLPDGRVILALGEAGVCVLDGESQGTQYFTFPATQFVASWNGDRLLALANRGDQKRITKLDLISYQYDDLGEVRLTAFATEYDGSIWYVANQCELYAVDATQSNFKVLWQMPNVLEEISSIVCNEKHCSFSTCQPQSDNAGRLDSFSDDKARRGKRIWKCDLPGLLLRKRTFMNGWIHRRIYDRQQALSTPSGLEINVGPSTSFSHSGSLLLMCDEQNLTLPHSWTRLDKVSTAADDTWIALTFTQIFPETSSDEPFVVPVSCWCYLIDVAKLQVRAKIFFDGATRLVPRLQYGVLTVSDDRGRVIAVDLASGAMLRNICV